MRGLAMLIRKWLGEWREMLTKAALPPAGFAAAKKARQNRPVKTSKRSRIEGNLGGAGDGTHQVRVGPVAEGFLALPKRLFSKDGCCRPGHARSRVIVSWGL